MLRKNLLFLILLSILFSCKEDSKIIITNKKASETEESVIRDPEVTTKKPLINITKDDYLEIWVRGDGAPGMYLDENNEVKGFYVELEKMVMKEMGQKFRFHPYFDVGPVVQKIKDGEAHIALSVPDLPDYRSFLHLSDKYEDLNYVTVVQKESESNFPTSRDEIIKSFYGKNIGVQTRGHIYQILREHKEINLVEYPTTTQAMADLDQGKLDAVPEVKRIMKYYSGINNWNLTAVGEVLFTKDICTGFSKALDYSVVERYNKALNSLIDSGKVEELYKNFFGE